ncbi:DUF4115 domain-containing protein [Pelagibacteraceae bacterium]|nr:DUF4115 domain-containing protein [Pelagibacteraceae bacterium]
MNKVGNKIKSLRILKKISIEKVSKELNISMSIIEMIENDQIDQNYDIVFCIGHIRSYCKLLEIDSDIIIENFKKQIDFSNKNLTYKIPKPAIKQSQLKINNFFPITLSIIIFVSFYFLFVKENNNLRKYALVPDLPEIYIPIVEQENINKIKSKNIGNNNEVNLFEEEFSFASAIASNKINKDINRDTITLKLLNPTWLQIRDNLNNIIFSKLMDEGEEYTYDASLNYNITAGNAGNILLIINKDVIGKIGKVGQVVDSIVIDNNFYN